MSVRGIFAISAVFPSITLMAGLYLKENRRTNPFESVLSDDHRGNTSFLQLAVANLKLVLKFLSYPFILKPLVFILLVIVCPGIDSAMFYYNTNVLKFDSTQLANIGMLSQIGTIFGQ